MKSQKKHFLDFRFKIPVLPYYIVFLAGKDTRLKEEQVPGEARAKQSGLVQACFYTGILFWVLMATVLLLLAIAYLVKTHAGINIFKNSSPIPEFLQFIRLCH